MKFIFIYLILIITSHQVFGFTLIAHRGLPRLHPEHSLSGLKAVLRYKVDYVEPDIVLSKDGIPVILHDIHLDTTTDVTNVFPSRIRQDGRYYAIDFTLKELKTLKINHRINLRTGRAAIASRKPLKNPTDMILTLNEFIKTVIDHNKNNKHQIGIYPEIKAPHFHEKMGLDSTDIIHKALLGWHNNNLQLKIIIQCFDSLTLKRLNREQTPFPLVQLIGENSWHETRDDYTKMRTNEGLKKISEYAAGVAPWLNHLFNSRTRGPTKFIAMAKEHGLFIHTYTLRNDALPRIVRSEKEIMQFLLKTGVDGVFTDNAHTTLTFLK